MNQTNHKASEERKYLTHDVLLGMIYHIPEEESLGSIVHSNIVFHKLKQKYASKSNLLEDIDFSTNGINPISNELTQGLWSLCLSHFIYLDENNKIKQIQKNKLDANKSIEDNVIPRFNKKQLKQLEMMAKDYIEISKVTKDYIEIAK